MFTAEEKGNVVLAAGAGVGIAGGIDN